MDLYKQQDRKFRLEIEGLRALAAILVAVYHIWFGNVSGGVDVFFVVSGFLITTSLINMYERTGKIDIVGYLLKLGKRLFPAAFTVLLFITVMSFFFLPQSQWIEIIKEIIASLIYVENWQLARNSVDYLAQSNGASPVQHFWAMSTQFQFYIIWTLVLIVAIFVAKKFNVKLRKTLLMILITIFILSLGYSIYITAANQPWAYFDTFARVWEFAAGGILCLLIANITLNKISSFLFGWIGLIGLVSCGIILNVSTVFPGYVALWPILSAILILIAGNKGGKFSVYRVLSSRPLVKFGGISYGFYLWHWPLLILYFNVTGQESVSLLDGLLIILSSVILSYLTTFLIEKPIRNRQIQSKPKLIVLLVSLAVPIVVLSGTWTLYIKDAQAYIVSSETIDIDKYPGANALLFDLDVDKESIYIPQIIQVKNDLPQSYYDDCHQGVGKEEIIICEYGETGQTEETIALVGGSHSAHWLPAIDIYAKEQNIKVLNITKSGCRFSSDYYPSSSDADQESCRNWNDNLIEKLVEIKPDLVFTTADASELEGIPEGYVETWKKLEINDINIFAIKDNPRAEFDIPTCVDINGVESEKCLIVNDLDDLSEDIDRLGLDNIYYADLTKLFCEEDICKPVVGNILVYKDAHHITSTYSKTLSSALGAEIDNAGIFFSK